MPAPPTIVLPPECSGDSPFIQRLFNEDGVLSYDAVIELIEQIEQDLLDPCTPEDERQICELIAFLARQGMLSDSTEDEKEELEADIEEMLNSVSEWKQISYRIGSQEFFLAPAIDYEGPSAVLCKGWFHKQWKGVKHFVKEHKTAVIVGSILIVAAVVVVVTVATVSATAATAAAATAAALESEPAAVQKQLSTLKTTASESELLSDSVTSDPEQGRIVGSALAHDLVHALPDPFQSESPITAGHGVIDNAFMTDQSPSYFCSQPSESKPLACSVLMQQGEQALKTGHYEQAVEQFSEAISIDPTCNEAYLQRAYANMGMARLEESLIDYNVYTSNEPARPSDLVSNSIDFSVGFVTNVHKGVLESGKHLASFAVDLAVHPIDTGGKVAAAFGALAQMAYSREWETLSQALAPEICEVVHEWETLSARERGERSGYLFGKYGGDILVPGAAAKVISTGLKEAKNIAIIAKNLQIAEETFALEALAGAGQRTARVADELGFTAHEMRQLKQAGNLEGTAVHQYEYLNLLEKQISDWLVHRFKSFQSNFCVKAAQIDERKFIRIALIRMNLRSLAVVDLSALSRRNCIKNF